MEKTHNPKGAAAPAKGEKIPYDELNKIAAQLYQQNQELVKRMNDLKSALEDKDFNYTSFFLTMLFKVLDHPESYKSDFVVWCTEIIEQMMYGLGNKLLEGDKGSEGQQESPKGTDEA